MAHCPGLGVCNTGRKEEVDALFGLGFPRLDSKSHIPSINTFDDIVQMFMSVRAAARSVTNNCWV